MLKKIHLQNLIPVGPRYIHFCDLGARYFVDAQDKFANYFVRKPDSLLSTIPLIPNRGHNRCTNSYWLLREAQMGSVGWPELMCMSVTL